MRVSVSGEAVLLPQLHPLRPRSTCSAHQPDGLGPQVGGGMGGGEGVSVTVQGWEKWSVSAW